MTNFPNISDFNQAREAVGSAMQGVGKSRREFAENVFEVQKYIAGLTPQIAVVGTSTTAAAGFLMGLPENESLTGNVGFGTLAGFVGTVGVNAINANIAVTKTAPEWAQGAALEVLGEAIRPRAF